MISSYGIPVGMTKKTADGINNGKEFKVEPHYAKSWYFNRSAPECEVQEDDSMVGKDTKALYWNNFHIFPKLLGHLKIQNLLSKYYRN